MIERSSRQKCSFAASYPDDANMFVTYPRCSIFEVRANDCTVARHLENISIGRQLAMEHL